MAKTTRNSTPTKPPAIAVPRETPRTTFGSPTPKTKPLPTRKKKSRRIP